MSKQQTIHDLWGVTPDYLTKVVRENPSLRGMMLGYIAEMKLRDWFQEDGRAAALRKDDDHDRKNKGDLVVTYKGREFKFEVKSLQTNSIRVVQPDGKPLKMVIKIGGKYRFNPEFEAIPDKTRQAGRYLGVVQCDASDKRKIVFPDGASVTTTCLQVGEFDVLAAGLFAFRNRWDFGFALNRQLPRSVFRRYSPEMRELLLKSLVPVSWPLQAPFVPDPFTLLDQLMEERECSKS